MPEGQQLAPPPRKKGRPPAPIPMENLWELLKAIEEDGLQGGASEKITIYRGHTSYRFKLRPAIFREINSKIRIREKNILRELITRHPEDFSGDANVFENLVRMQHYGLPTRLLDVTYNPMIAAFFACQEQTKDHAEIVSITVDLEFFKYYDSDTVHCIANLANLTSSEQRDIKDCVDDEHLKICPAGKRLFDFVVQKRPNFTNRIVRRQLSNVYLVSPKLNNPRIRAQDGAFLIFGVEEELAKQHGFTIKKYRIHKDKTESIRNSLEKLGIKESVVYPSLDRTANQILTKYRLQNNTAD